MARPACAADAPWADFRGRQSHGDLADFGSAGNFKISTGNRVVYFGRAVVSNVIHTGGSLICEAKLDDLGSDTAFFLPPRNLPPILRRPTMFFQTWQNNYRISDEFKVLVTDVQSYLTGVRHWLEQLEFGMKTQGDQRNRSAPFWMPSRPESSPPSTASTSVLKKSFTRCRRKRAARTRILSGGTGTNYFSARRSPIAPITSPTAMRAITK